MRSSMVKWFLLAHCLPGKKPADYILLILKRKQPELQYKDYEWKRGRYNRGSPRNVVLNNLSRHMCPEIVLQLRP